VARNEPVTFAVRKAIEAGVAEIIHSGAKKDLWKIKLPPEPVLPEVVEESDAEVVTEEEEVSLEVEQTTIKIKTREEYLAEKKAKKLALLEEKRLKKEALEAEKHLKKVQKNEVSWYNKANGTNFKTWEEYQTYLKHTAAIKIKESTKWERKKAIQIHLNALEVADESVITESNTVTSNSD